MYNFHIKIAKRLYVQRKNKEENALGKEVMYATRIVRYTGNEKWTHTHTHTYYTRYSTKYAERSIRPERKEVSQDREVRTAVSTLQATRNTLIKHYIQKSTNMCITIGNLMQ